MNDVIEKVLAKLQRVKEQPNGGFMAFCPAHADLNPSLSISEGEDGRVLLHCHAGCSLDAILQTIGLDMSNLFQERMAGLVPKVVAEYKYTDREGNLLYKAVREFPKRFKYCRPDGCGWIWDLKGVQRVLYKLPAVADAVERGDTVFIVEGEKDVDTLVKAGFTATCNPCGAGKWKPEYSECLRGANVVIIPDNDDVGRQHAFRIASALMGIANNIKVVELPNPTKKGYDVSDWLLSDSHTADELLALVDAVPDYSLLTPEKNKSEVPLTDLGNAERLIAKHGSNLRYHIDSNKWLVWNGKCWKPDNTGEINRLARSVIRGIADEIKLLYDRLKEADSEEQRKELSSRIQSLERHMKSSESRSRLDAMVSLARHCPGVPVLTEKLDTDLWLFNCANGTIDLRTGKIKPHERADLITKMVAIDFSPDAECPRFMHFLDGVFQGDKELIGFVKRVSGYTLTGSTREEALFILNGKAQTGKTKLVEILRAVLGEYSQNTPITTFTERRDSTTFDLPGLAGARLVTAAESEGEQSFNEALLKRLTGGDPVTACYKFKDYFTYIPTFKILFSTNHMPLIKSQDFAMKRRIKLIPFKQRFYDPEDGKLPLKDNELISKLLAELPGILRWMVDGCLEWQKDGLKAPAIVRQEVEKLFDEQDPLGEFLEAMCLIEPGAEVVTGRLWEAYWDWCMRSNIPPAFKQTQAFSRNLVQRDGIDSRRGTGGVRFLTGIKLLGDPDKPPAIGFSDVSDEKKRNLETCSDISSADKVSENSQNTSLSSLESLNTSEFPQMDNEDGEAF